MRLSIAARVVRITRRFTAVPRVTQADVARLAGVSQATVSLVLQQGADSHKARVGDVTRQRVLEAIRTTGYTVNPLAQGLARGRNSMVGVFTYESVFPKSGGDFYYPFLEGIESAAESLGLDLLLFTSAPSRGNDRRSLAETGWNRVGMTDGCLLLGRQDDKYDTRELIAQRFPFVFLGRRESTTHEVPYVGADYRSATQHLVQHLLSLGHDRIAFLGDLGESESSLDRVLGYREVMTDAGLRPMLFNNAAFTETEAVDAVIRNGASAVLLGPDCRPDSIRAVAAERGLHVPTDLSLAVLGQPTTALADEHQWTGFRIPREQMGYAALQLLAGLIEEQKELDMHQLVPCEFVEGETATHR